MAPSSKCARSYGQMNEPPGARMRYELSGLTVAEHFRDQGQDVLFFVDRRLPRFTQAARKMSARPHPIGGRLSADACYRHGRSRSASPPRRRARSRRCKQLCPGRRLDRSGARRLSFAHLDATTVLSRGIAEKGIYPAVDPLEFDGAACSIPRPSATEHYAIARRLILQRYERFCRSIIAILGMDELSEEDLTALLRRRSVHRLARQAGSARRYDQGLRVVRRRL